MSLPRSMSVPRATMRLQFHRDFTFASAAALVPYFAALGISHLYASPILMARPGSLHGYDVVDPTRVNPELGGEDGLRQLVERLRRHDMGLIVDIVPNHMAAGSGNAWWMDVLARGTGSRYAKFFDIDWTPPSSRLHGKVLLPILGRPYGEALAAGEITLRCEAGRDCIRYFDHVLPLAPGTAGTSGGGAHRDFDPASRAGRERLHDLLEQQHYRLAWWRSANDEINWRRFFDINELAAIRVEDDEVFEAVHATSFRLYAEGLIDGLRVDHVDGLADPGRYCRKLRGRLRELQTNRAGNHPNAKAYFVVEKILARDETLPADWETDGTTGYDFMDEVSALLHDPRGEQPLRNLWEKVSGRPGDFEREELAARRLVLDRSFAAQLETTVQTFLDIARSDLETRDFSRAAIRRCLTEILLHFRVYRIYARVGEASSSDLTFLSRAVADATRTCLRSDRWLVEALGGWLAGKRIGETADLDQNVGLVRFQQLSAPLCAKAVEDTAFYRYGRLISRNDVGFDARLFACSMSDFHERMQARARRLPHAMLATATHDHKKGEDVRARLAVLSEVAQDWAKAVRRWLAVSEPLCTEVDGASAPYAGDRAILFQMIVGAWPPRLTASDKVGLARYAKRISTWQEKALREAKLFSDWSAPNEAYEQASARLIGALFAAPSELLNEIAEFARRIAPAGAANGLAQMLIRLTAPGVSDTFQGTEYWDFSLVDPDNRSPVDYALRSSSLDETAPPELVSDWKDGRIKQAVMARVLAVRKNRPELFADGGYSPLEVVGPMSEHVGAFMRTLHQSAAITVFARSVAHLLDDAGALHIAPSQWNETYIVIPSEFHGDFWNALDSSGSVTIDGALAVERALQHAPVALITNVSE